METLVVRAFHRGGGGQGEQSRGTCVSKWRVERATGGAWGTSPIRKYVLSYRYKTGYAGALSTASASGGVFREPQYKHYAFTMAEILLSLTIIGVVAAITLPSLTGNINERTWNTQRKALYARFSQALALMPALNGYGTFSAEQTDSSGSITQSAVDTTTETFITDGLAKVMKINNICDNEHLEDCGIPSTISPGNGASAVNISDITSLRGFNSLFAASAAKVPLDTKAAAFETQNGESIIVYYNPNCTPDMSGNSGNYYPHAEMCANFVYDLNGNKGPNTVGKDIGFITAFYPTDPIIVSPMPLATDATWASQIDASKSCQKQDSESRLPNLNELASMMYNKKLIGITTGDYWSSSSVSASQGWIQNFSLGNRYLHPRGNSLAVRCVKR